MGVSRVQGTQLGPERRQGAINDVLEAREVPAGLLGDRLALLGTVGVLEASVRVVDKSTLVGFVQVDGWRRGELTNAPSIPKCASACVSGWAARRM